MLSQDDASRSASICAIKYCAQYSPTVFLSISYLIISWWDLLLFHNNNSTEERKQNTNKIYHFSVVIDYDLLMNNETEVQKKKKWKTKIAKKIHAAKNRRATLRKKTKSFQMESIKLHWLDLWFRST
jgi:hypothetical protein